VAKIATTQLSRAKGHPVFTDVDLDTLDRSYTVEDVDGSNAGKGPKAGKQPKSGKGSAAGSRSERGNGMKKVEKKVHKLEELLQDGFRLIRWDGK
jgi:hypothetical protein